MISTWGPPQPDFQEHVGRTVQDATRMPNGRTAKEHGDDARQKRKIVWAHVKNRTGSDLLSGLCFNSSMRG
jgi:hypothetical protein